MPTPEELYNNLQKIAKYNREHGTNFWKMDQVIEHDKQQALEKTQNRKKRWYEYLANVPEGPGDAILNKAIEVANASELPETRSKIYNDTGKAILGTTATALTLPAMASEFTTYGLLGGTARLAGGFGGSALGSYTLGKAGEAGDKHFGTTWMKPTGQVVGGFAGWGPGSNLGYKGALDLAIKAPTIANVGVTKRFIGDMTGRMLDKNIQSASDLVPEIIRATDSTKSFARGIQTPQDMSTRYYHDGKWDVMAMVQDFRDGKNDAIEYLTSDTKKTTDAHNIELAKRIGLRINPEPTPGKANIGMHRTTPMAPNSSWIGQSDNGFYITVGGMPDADAATGMITDHPELDQIVFNHYTDISDASFHEHLHRGDLGAVPHRSVYTPEQVQIAKNTGDFYKWKTNRLFKQNTFDDIDDYIRTPREAAVNLMEIGRRAGISPGQAYPGKTRAEQIFSNIIENDGKLGEYLNRTKWDTKPKRVWDALTGKYYATIPFGTGLLLQNIIKEPSSSIKSSNSDVLLQELDTQLKQGGTLKFQNSGTIPDTGEIKPYKNPIQLMRGTINLNNSKLYHLQEGFRRFGDSTLGKGIKWTGPNNM